MVKNQGGNKAKKFASKSLNISDRATRFASEDGEKYAVVQRMMGNNICEVLCIDGKIRNCVIRGKFSGRGKRDNRLSRGIWVLIGLRDWEVSSKDKEKCDLLEVYNDNDKEKLIKNSTENFRAFLGINNEFEEDNSDLVKFVNDQEELINSTLDEESEDDTYEDENVSEQKSQNPQESLLSKLDWVSIDDI